MSLKKYSFASIFCYGLIFLSPLILSSIGIIHTVTGVITATTIAYIIGAVVLAFFYFKQNEPLPLEAAIPKASMLTAKGFDFTGACSDVGNSFIW